MAVKLPESVEALLTMPFARPARRAQPRQQRLARNALHRRRPPARRPPAGIHGGELPALAPKTLTRELDAHEA